MRLIFKLCFYICITLEFLAVIISALRMPDFVEFGLCTKVLPQKNLDLNLYSGLWYTQQSIDNEFVEAQECENVNFTWSGEFMTVISKGLDANGDKVRQTSGFKLMENVPKNTPVIVVNTPGLPAAPYVIHYTDYNNVACISSCLDYFGFRAQFLFIFTRQPVPQRSHLEKCKTLFTKLGLPANKLKPRIQGKSCPYWEHYSYKNARVEKPHSSSLLSSKKDVVDDMLWMDEKALFERQTSASSAKREVRGNMLLVLLVLNFRIRIFL